MTGGQQALGPRDLRLDLHAAKTHGVVVWLPAAAPHSAGPRREGSIRIQVSWVMSLDRRTRASRPCLLWCCQKQVIMYLLQEGTSGVENLSADVDVFIEW
jgi:hypothetical protein